MARDAAEGRGNGPGSELDDFAGTERYVVESRLGRGGFGAVYRVHDRERNADVALKLLYRRQPSAIALFKNEFRSLQDLSHHNLVQLYELNYDLDNLFFTMELVVGPDFYHFVRGGDDGSARAATLLATITTSLNGPTAEAGGAPQGVAPHAQNRPLAEAGRARLRSALRQLADGVSALHAAGRLHRDIKPQNVKVTRDGRVVLLDFGLVTETATSTGSALAGTPGFIAPELWHGQPATEASDWYSVGVMLHQVLADELPLAGHPANWLVAQAALDRAEPWHLDPTRDLEGLCVELLRPVEERPDGARVRALLGLPPVPVSAGMGAPSAVDRGTSSFLGREREFERLEAALAAMRSGTAVAVRICGSSGLGKTTMLGHFLSRAKARDPGLVVLAGRCFEQEHVPYKGLDGVVDALRQHLHGLSAAELAACRPREAPSLARLFPILGRLVADPVEVEQRRAIPDIQETLRRASAALRELLAGLAERGPLVIAVDDVQWGDLDSVGLLLELLRSQPRPKFLLLLAHRPDSESPFLSALDRAWAGLEMAREQLDLKPLSRQESQQLVAESLLAADPGAREAADAIVTESDGNPFLLQELLQEALSNRVSFPGPAGRVLSVVDARLAALQEGARRIFEMTAVAGRPVPVELVARAADVPEDVSDALSRLRAVRLVALHPTGDGTVVELYHDRLREALVQSLTSDGLSARHARLAEVLEATTLAATDPELLFYHFDAAGNRDKAASYAPLAAEHAARSLAFLRAAELFRRAAALTDDAAARRSLTLKHADALVNAGHGATAAPIYQEVAVAAEGTTAHELRQKAAEQYLISGHIDAGGALLERLCRDLHLPYPNGPGRALAGAVWRLLGIWRWRGIRYKRLRPDEIPPAALLRVDVCLTAARGLIPVDTIRGAFFAFEALGQALDAGEPTRVAASFAYVSVTLMAGGDGSLARFGQRLLDEARATAEASGDPRVLGTVRVSHGQICMFRGQWSEAIAQSEAGLTLLRERCQGVVFERNIGELGALRAFTEKGELALARARSDEALQHSLRIGDRYGEVTARLLRAWLFLLDDRPEDAASEAAEALSVWSQRAFLVQHLYALRIDTYADLYRGAAGAAWTRLQEALPQLKRSMLLSVPTGRIDFLVMRAHAALARAASSPQPRPFLESAARDARALGKEQRQDAIAHGAMIAGAVELARGHRDRVAALLDKAALGFRGADMLVDEACVRYCQGRIQGGATGETLCREALAMLHAHGVKRPLRWLAVNASGFVIDGDAERAASAAPTGTGKTAE